MVQMRRDSAKCLFLKGPGSIVFRAESGHSRIQQCPCTGREVKSNGINQYETYKSQTEPTPPTPVALPLSEGSKQVVKCLQQTYHLSLGLDMLPSLLPSQFRPSAGNPAAIKTSLSWDRVGEKSLFATRSEQVAIGGAFDYSC